MENLIDEIIKDINNEMQVGSDVQESVSECYRNILNKHLLPVEQKLKWSDLF